MISRNDILKCLFMILLLAAIGPAALAEVHVDVWECTENVDLTLCPSVSTSSCNNGDWDLPVRYKEYLVEVTRSDGVCFDWDTDGDTECPDCAEDCDTDSDCWFLERIEVYKSDQGAALLCPVTPGWVCTPAPGMFVCTGPADDPVEFMVSPTIGSLGKRPASVFPTTFSQNAIDHDDDDEVPTIIDTVGIPSISWWSMALLMLVLIGSIAFYVMRLRRSPSS